MAHAKIMEQYESGKKFVDDNEEEERKEIERRAKEKAFEIENPVDNDSS